MRKSGLPKFRQMSFGLQESKEKLRWLSHTGIEMVNRCGRCFYLAYRYKIRQPEGIQSRLANRFDIVLKNYFDGYRKQGKIPPMVKGKLPGQLQNPFKEKYFTRINDSYGFWGKLDECMVNDGLHIPVDFKTSSSDPREKDILDAYRHQIDEYVLLLDQNHLRTAGYGYLIFFFPDFSDDVHNGFPMVTHIKKIEANPSAAKKRIQKAIEVLEGNLPDPAEDCPFCSWFETVKQYYI